MDGIARGLGANALQKSIEALEKIEQLTAIKILNKGQVITATTESAVQTVATNYIVNNYGRQPKALDGLIITITALQNDKILYTYSEASSMWENVGINVNLSNYVSVSEQTFTAEQKAQARTNIGVPEINDSTHTTTSTWSSEKISSEIGALSRDLTIILNAPDSGSIVTTINIYEVASGELEETVNYNGTPVTISLPRDFVYKVVLGSAVGYRTPLVTEYRGIMNHNQTITATYRGNIVYGIRRSLPSLSSAWVRTDDSVGLTANATKDGSAVTNDFDDLFPWNEIKTVNLDIAGNIVAEYGDDNFTFTPETGVEVMTYIPSFYIKRWQDADNEYIQISEGGGTGFEHIRAFYIGRYTTSDGVRSVSGVSSTVNKTIGAFRSEAMAKGTGWQQFDVYAMSVIQCLYLVEYANGDSQAMLGNGNVSNSAQITLGGCDTLGMASGCLANDSKSAVIYRGVENLFGNIWQWVDGINIKDGQSWVCFNYANYVSDKFEAPYVQLGYLNATASGNVYQRGYDANCQIIGITSAVGTSTYGDYYWYNSGNRVLHFGGGWYHGGYCGVFCLDGNGASSSAYSNIGSRLLKFVQIGG